MTPFERFHASVEKALERHLDDLERADGALSHEAYCLCPECVCVRGVRGELSAYAKGAERAAKKKSEPENFCPIAPSYSACPRFQAKECDGILCKAEPEPWRVAAAKEERAAKKKRGKAK